MFNFVFFALGLFSGFPKPYLVSVDIGSVQAGGGVGVLLDKYVSSPFPILPDMGFSIGQMRVYWGSKWAFVAGLKIHRGVAEYLPFGFFNPTLALRPELAVPQLGISHFTAPPQPRLLKPKACASSIFYNVDYVPRFDLVVGFSFFNPLFREIISGPLRFCPTLRTEAKFLIIRSIQVLLEDRVEWTYNDYTGTLDHPSNAACLSLCFALGNDYIISGGDKPKGKIGQ
jgi:hypothetical protein